jgi:hypothetical protein
MFNGWKITNILDVGLCELDTADGPYNKTGYRLDIERTDLQSRRLMSTYLLSALEILLLLHENKR